MKSAKQIVFRYNGDPNTEDVEPDMLGVASVPQKGSLVQRKGKPRKVVEVNVETIVTAPRAVPVYRVFLTDEL